MQCRRSDTEARTRLPAWLADVVRIQHRIFSGLPQPFRTICHDVGQRAHKHAEVAVEHAYPAHGLGAIDSRRCRVGCPVASGGPCTTTGVGRNGSRIFLARHRTRTRVHRLHAEVLNVLCRFRCMTSTPKSPGRVLPTSAFMLAPSMYSRAPLECSIVGNTCESRSQIRQWC